MDSTPTKNNPDTMIVTIDGPAGAGKSTIAKGLAGKLGCSYLDTGAMYRALTLKGLRAGIDLENEDALVNLAKNTSIDLKFVAPSVKVWLDQEDVSDEIRSPEVTNNTFYIARAPRIREIMVKKQREIGSRQSVVIEGRDTGTVVFPNATFKFYLDADVKERARRRYDELRAAGKDVDLENITLEMQKRDQSDFERKVGPLKRAPDAHVIDSTNMTVDQSVEVLLKVIKDHG